MDNVKRVSGKDIILEEMPQGLFINDKVKNTVILISSLEDADLIINSLNKMKEYFGEQFS